MSEQLIQRHDKSFESMVAGASTAELVGGIAAIVLSIIGLSSYDPPVMAAVGFIALGAAFALNGGLLASERSSMGASRMQTAEFTGGVSVEAVSGIAAVVLGILCLLKIDAAALMPVAALVLGTGMIFSGGALARLSAATAARQEPVSEQVTHGILAIATGLNVLVGVAAIVLAILGLSGFAPLMLSLVALLALGAASLVGGASTAGRVFGTPHVG